MTGKSQRGWQSALAGAAVAALSLSAAGQNKPAVSRVEPSATPVLRFDPDIKPFLTSYCVKCHGPTKPKRGLNFTVFSGESAFSQDPKLWRLAAQKLEEREMPPDENRQPSDELRARIAAGLVRAVEAIDYSALPPDPGRRPIQRLTRDEYNRTIQDLLGVSLRPADGFPSDPGGGKGFENNAETLSVPPLLLEKYYDAAEQVVAAADPAKLFPVRPDAKTPSKAAARRVIEGFAFRAFRRPAEKPVVERWAAFFEKMEKAGKSYDDALRAVFRGMLTSPAFLYKIEADRSSREPWLVDDFEMAVRLSYFLGSTLPDAPLFDLARAKKLQDPAALEAQARRWIAGPRFRAFAETFVTQWLQIGKLETTAVPDPARFPGFTPVLRDAMTDEAVEYFAALVRENRSLLELLDSDYTYVNEPLARHYGLEGVKGKDLKKVTLKDRNRGGVLGFASVLIATSHPLRTSPTVRGKWILEVLLGAPPSPPPPNVPSLPSDDAPKEGLSVRQQLERHRQNPACASCHARIDPLGFSLENFDPVGRWRTESGGKPLDTLGTLPTGEKVRSPAELKALLLARKGDFVRNLTEHLLSYALGRDLEPPDQAAVRKICDAAAAKNQGALAWMLEIVQSYPFRYRRGMGGR